MPHLPLVRLLLVIFIAVAAGGFAEAAKKKHNTPAAPSDPPMTVVIVRDNHGSCDPSCPQWISAEGRITPATPGLFRKVLKQMGKARFPVIIASPGGDVDAALAIGRMIRAAKLDVGVGWTIHADCKPGSKGCALPKERKGIYRGVIEPRAAYCASACPFILAAGTRRLAGPESYVGVHQISTTMVQDRIFYREKYRIVNGKKKVISRTEVGRKRVKSYVTTKTPKAYAGKINTYLAAMGIDLSLMALLDKAPPSSIHFMTFSEFGATRLVTGFLPSTSLINASACRAKSPAPYCVLIEPPKAKAKAVAAAASVGGEEAAGKEAPMTFIVARGYAGPCEPLCPQWIAAEGEITPGSVKALKATLGQIEGMKLPVIINSPGGDFDAALEMGGMIHDAQLDIVVARTGYRDCQPAKRSCALPNGAASPGFIVNLGKCQGSCMFVLAGGKKRYVAQGNAIFTIRRPDDYGAKAAIPASSVRLHGYFESLGIDNSLLKFMNELRKGDERALPPGFSQQVGLVSAEIDPMALVGHNACFPTEPASYCVKLQ